MPRKARTQTLYLIVWWSYHNPYAALFDSKEAADAAANVRNAVTLTLSGSDVRVDGIVDWYRRDGEGRPMPIEWQDLAGQARVPWLQSKPVV
jgi:hypothetical protein